MTTHHRVLLSLLTVGMLAGAACSSSAHRQLRDEAGHTCSVPEPPGGQALSCGPAPAPSAACSGGMAACWAVGMITTATDFDGPAAICAACCNGDATLLAYNQADCSEIACSTSDDCPVNKPSCTNGRCRR